MKEKSVLKQIAALEAMSLAELKERWRELFGTDAPGYSRAHLVKRLAYRIQELAFGGPSDAARDELRSVVAREGLDVSPSKIARMARRQRKKGAPVIGTRLIREWQGRRYEVTVVRDGFELEGRIYRSLSAVARSITGTRWNGHLFFGLKNRKAKDGG